MPPVVTITSSGPPTGMPFVFRSLATRRSSSLRKAGRLDVVAVVGVDRPVHPRLHRVGCLEADVALIEPEGILDRIHHVADADDAGEGHGIEVLAHGVMLPENADGGGGFAG